MIIPALKIPKIHIIGNSCSKNVVEEYKLAEEERFKEYLELLVLGEY